MSNSNVANELAKVDPQNMAMLQAVATLLKDKQIYEYSISEQRQLFRELQGRPEQNLGITKQQFRVETSHGEVENFLYKPKAAADTLNFVYFLHGGAWTVGGSEMWESFLFDLVERTQSAVLFPEYTLAPEKQCPAQHEQCLAVLQHVVRNSAEFGLKVNKLVIACDSVGAQLASAISILNRERSLRLPIIHQIFLHPFLHTTTTSRLLEMPLASSPWTEQSYDAYFPAGMDRSDILACPDAMSGDQLALYMPSTTIVTSELDGVRDQGEEFARRLQKAGVPCGIVRAVGCLHDCEIFRYARDSPTAELVMITICGKLRQLFFR